MPLIVAVVLGAATLAGWRTHWPAAVFGVRNAAHDVSASGQSGASPNAAATAPPSQGVPSQDPATGAASAAQNGSAQQTAANQLAALLSQSVSDRNAVNAAYNDVLQCGPDLDQDAQVFQNAAGSRQQLLSQLAGLPSRSALPPSMLQDLSGAWQVSVQVDGDYQQWAQDRASDGCAGDSRTDPNYVAAMGPNHQATADKTAFVGQWNVLAGQYGLTQYQQGNL